MQQGPLHDRIALVTGAGSGFGFAAVSALLKAGAHVIAVSAERRAPEKPIGFSGQSVGEITRIRVDNEARAPFARIAADFYERFGRLDIVLSAAHVESTPALITRGESAEFENLLSQTVIANREIIRAFDPLLQRAPSGRAFFAVAPLTRRVRPFYGAPAVAQAALEMLIDTYAAESMLTDVRVRAVDPGYQCPRSGMEDDTPVDFRGAAEALVRLCLREELPEAATIVLRDLLMPVGLPRRDDLMNGKTGTA